MNALAAKALSSLVQHSVLRVFVVDDSAVVCERLLKTLNAMPAVTVLGYAITAADAIEDILSAPPDVVLLDLKLASGSGIQVLRAIRQRMPHVIVIMLTNHSGPEYRRACLDAGANFFLDKTNEFQKIPDILDQLKS
jgi:DNA-binding NarL/FixJ family response regulator